MLCSLRNRIVWGNGHVVSVDAMFSEKQDSVGKRILKCRFILMWHRIKESSEYSGYPMLRPSGATPSIEDLREWSQSACVASQIMVGVDERKAYINGLFDPQFEQAGANGPNSVHPEALDFGQELDPHTLPWAIVRIKKPDGTYVEQLPKGGVDGTRPRGQPDRYQCERDGRFAMIGMYRVPGKPSTEVGPYLVPSHGGGIGDSTMVLYNERTGDTEADKLRALLGKWSHSDQTKAAVEQELCDAVPFYPFSKTRPCALTHVDDFAMRLNGTVEDGEGEGTVRFNFKPEDDVVSQCNQLIHPRELQLANHCVSKCLVNFEGRQVELVLQTVEFRSVELHLSVRGLPLVFHTLWLYQVKLLQQVFDGVVLPNKIWNTTPFNPNLAELLYEEALKAASLVEGGDTQYSDGDIKTKQVFSVLSLYLLLFNVNLTMGVRELASSRPGPVLQAAYTQLFKFLNYYWCVLNLPPVVQTDPSGVDRPFINSPSDASLQPRCRAEQCGATFNRGSLLRLNSERVGPAVKTVPDAEAFGVTTN